MCFLLVLDNKYFVNLTFSTYFIFNNINLLLDQEQQQKQKQQKEASDAHDAYRIYRDYFYVYFPEYSLWSIEIHLINYVLNKHSRITPESLKQTIDTYVDSNGAFTILSPEFIFAKDAVQLCITGT